MKNVELQVSPWNQARERLILALALTGTVVWAYWTALTAMADRWSRDAEYSHGYLVPLFALFILWMRRDMLDLSKLKPSWWGLPLLLAGVSMRSLAARYYLEWFDFLSLIPCVVGVGLMLGGWRALRWFWPAAGFLFFMIPLPFTLEVALREPLRKIGTVASTYIMQTCGLPAFSEGMVIVVNDVRIGVVEACSGLRMLMIFFALASAVALLSQRPYWERAVIVISAVPIALISNVARITVTGILYGMNLDHLAKVVFHDLAGWLMMPLGLLLLWAELWFLTKLFIIEDDQPMALGLQTAPSVPSAPVATV